MNLNFARFVVASAQRGSGGPSSRRSRGRGRARLLPIRARARPLGLITVGFVTLAWARNAGAQTNTNNIPTVSTNAPGTNAAPKAMPATVVTATPLASGLFDLAQPVTVLSGGKLDRSLASTLGETLGREPGITSSYYGPNSSRPIIRGLDRDHIRLLQNGIGTMDASAISVDHTVAQDPLSVSRIEVVRGPAALLYGPTAVGGVVNTIDNRIPDTRIAKPITGYAEGRYSSPDNGRSGSGLAEGGFKGFNYHLDGFLRANDDLTIPGFARSERLRATQPLPPGEEEAKGTLPNSHAQSDGGTAGTSYVWDQGYAGAAFQGYNNSYGTVAEETATIRMFQRRLDLAGAFYEPASFLQSVKWKFGASHFTQTEFDSDVPGTVFKLKALNARLEALHQPLGALEGAVGYEGRHDDLNVTGDEAFLPPTDTLVNSAFLFEEVKWDQVKLQFGGRFDYTGIDAAADPKFGPARSLTFSTGSGAAGVVYHPVEAYSGGLNFAYTERAPVHQELFANGADLGAGAFLVGDPTLQPERSYGIDLTLRRETGKVTGSATFFYTRFENFISPIPRGATDPTFNLPIYDFKGVPADFFGGEGSVMFHLYEEVKHRINLELKTDYTHATERDTDEPLPRIPPWRFGAELSYQWNERFGASVDVLRAQEQDRVAPNELPTDGYTMLNASVSYRLVTGRVSWDLLLKGTNLLNEEARLHTSYLKDIAPLGARGALVALRAAF